MKKKYLLSILITITILLQFTLSVFAEIPAPPEIHGEAGVLMEMKTGRVLYSKNADAKMYPASTTKILTGIIALEKATDLSEVVTASSAAINSITLEDSHMGILVGEQLTLEQLINGMLIYSANDAANVLAIHFAGSLDAFAEIMNQKAKEIGAVNSNFVNPHGFHNDNHYTTANDLAAIARYAMKNEKFREIVSTKRYNIPPTNKYKEERILSTTNHLISKIRNSNHFYAPAIGIKTGYTSQALNCLVSAASKDNTELLSVLLKCKNEDSASLAYSFVDSKALFEYGFENYAYQTIASPGDVVADTKVLESKNSVPVVLTPETEVASLLPKSINKTTDITTNITKDEKITAPITKGDVLGSVTYTYNGETLGTTSLIAANDVERDIFLFIINTIIKILTSPLFYLPIILLVVLFFVLKFKRQQKRRNRRGKLSYPSSKSSRRYK